MKKLTTGDLYKPLNKSGVTGAIKASQVLEATKLYIQSEIPTTEYTHLEPLFVRGKVMVVKSSSPALSQLLKVREDDLLEYLKQATGVEIERIQFRI